MSNLIDRLKVTTAKQIQPAVAKKTLPASIKIPGPTTIKVAPMVEPSVGKPTKIDSARAQAFVEASLRNKMAECKPKVDIGINEEIIEKYRDEYQQFLKELESMDFSSMIFGKPAETTVSTEGTAPLAQEEVPLANGISVGEEAGDAVVIPTTTTPKKTRKKKAVEEVVTEPTEAPAEV